MKVYSFPHGGIELSDRSAPSREASALSFLPGIAIIPVIQHNGVHAYPVARVGSHVEEGQLIARGQGAGSANIHAPVPGTVIRYVNWKLPEKITNGAIVIRLEGEFGLLGKEVHPHAWEDMSAFKLRDMLSEYGVIEMEGRGRPLSEVFSINDGAQTNSTLVLRCVFDDPWLAADYCLCQERPEAVAGGMIIAAKAAGAEQMLIAVSAPEHPTAQAIQDELTRQGASAAIVQVSSKYPQRNRAELTHALRRYEKSEKAALGALVFLGPATLAAAYDAVRYRRPVLDRYVAVGGSALKKPRVLKVRIGTRLSDLFTECGGCAAKPKRIASGSPMTGHAVFSLDEPVIKTTYAVFAIAQETFTGGSPFLKEFGVLDLRSRGRTPGKITEKKYDRRHYVAAQQCINCGECREVCPVGLDPEDIFKNISEKKHGLSVSRMVMRCHGCGCCEAVCPSGLPLCTALINPAFKGD